MSSRYRVSESDTSVYGQSPKQQLQIRLAVGDDEQEGGRETVGMR